MSSRRIAHRGVSARHPENTLAAFQAALDEGCWDGVETDVQLDAAGEAILRHDEMGPNSDVRTALRLDDFLVRFGGKLELLLEAKLHPNQRPELIDRIAEAILAHDLVETSWLLCFDDTALRHCHKQYPTIRCVLNLAKAPTADLETAHLSALSICIDALNETPDLGPMPWMTWTCNTHAQRENAKRWGAGWILWDG